MKKRKKGKLWLTFLVEIITLAVLGTFLVNMQTGIALRTQKNNSKEKLQTIAMLCGSNDQKEYEEINTYDQLYTSKAEVVSLLARTQRGFEYTDANMEILRQKLNVDNVLILNPEGTPLAQARHTVTNYSAARFNQLLAAFENGVSSPFNVLASGERFRYYGSKIDDEHMVVVMEKPDVLYENLDNNTSVASTLSGISVGREGFAFAVSHMDYTFAYHPDKALIGKDALSAGIPIEDLIDGFEGYLTVDGQELYCVEREIGENYVFCAVPAEEITGTINTTVLIVLLIFAIIVTLIIVYAYLTKKELADEEDKAAEESAEKEERKRKAGQDVVPAETPAKAMLDRKMAARIIPVAVVGAVVIVGLSAYLQTLFALSQQSISNNHKTQEVADTLTSNNIEIDRLKKQYNENYIEKCRLAAYVVSRLDKKQLTDEFMLELQDKLQVSAVTCFDTQGRVYAAGKDYWNFVLSDAEGEQSAEFRDILNGTKTEIIQEAELNEVENALVQYMGVALRDETTHKVLGLVQIEIQPKKLENMLAKNDTVTVVNSTEVGKRGFAFVTVPGEPDENGQQDMTFLTYPDAKWIGKSVYAYGMKDYQFVDGYCDYITLNGNKYFTSALQIEDAYVFVAVPDEAIVNTRTSVSLAIAVASILCLVLIVLIMSVGELKAVSENETGKKIGENKKMINVVLADGRTSKTESVLFRWSRSSVSWQDRTAGQKMAVVLNVILGIVAVFMVVMVMFESRFFSQDSMVHYILKGNWHKSVNIFAVTSCIIVAISFSTVIKIIRKLLMWLAKTMSAKGETICRLLDNFLRFAAYIGIAYYCLERIGVDTATLVASAGILSLIIGLGAQSLINDILAGFFIVFEGEFQVGDIIMIGDFRGTVMEIGIRTTKVKEPGGNIKVFANRNVTNVLNMTKDYSMVMCDVGIEYGESLEYVESILQEELPGVQKRLPAIVEGPFYKGVAELGDNSVNIRFVAKCAETDRAQLGRDLNREIKLIFDRNNINIPFPQIVLNQPVEFHTATCKMQKDAEEFREEQNELSQNIAEVEEKEE